MPVNYRLCSQPLQYRSVLSRSVSKVFPLLKHILCTAGRKKIPADCVEIATLLPGLVHKHRFHAQGLPPQKEGMCLYYPDSTPAISTSQGWALSYWATDTGEALQFKKLVSHSLFALTKKTETEKCLFKADVYFLWYKIHICSKGYTLSVCLSA